MGQGKAQAPPPPRPRAVSELGNMQKSIEAEGMTEDLPHCTLLLIVSESMNRQGLPVGTGRKTFFQGESCIW